MKEHFSISLKHYMTVQYKRVGTIYELTQTAKGETETLTVAFFVTYKQLNIKFAFAKSVFQFPLPEITIRMRMIAEVRLVM